MDEYFMTIKEIQMAYNLSESLIWKRIKNLNILPVNPDAFIFKYKFSDVQNILNYKDIMKVLSNPIENVIYVERVYFLAESIGNFYEIDKLKKEDWEQ